VIPFTRGLNYVQCIKNRQTRKNYIVNFKIFQEHQLNSRRFPVFPGVVDTLYNGASLLGRRLPSRVRQHSALSALS